MRTLIVVPIIHTERDMGSLLAQIKHEYVTRFGTEKWTEHLETIEEVWDDIARMINALDLPFQNLRLYQDGLPVCGKEEAIVREVAASGSRNHVLLATLIDRGAQIVGTESPKLLLQEYEAVKRRLANPGATPEFRAGADPESRQLLIERDVFIASRINETLKVGEIGVLFLGLAHAVEQFLAPDLLVQHLLPTLGGQPASSPR